MKKIIFIAAALLMCLYAIPAGAQGAAVSQDKSYELITPASSGYPDTTAHKLTNGVYAAANASGSFYQSPEYVGFNQTAKDENDNFVIILDLGSVMTDLSNFEISYLNQTDIGIFAPSSVTFSVSEIRNGNYTPVGTTTIDEPTTAGITESKKTAVTPEGAISGQYVKIEVKHRGDFVDESGSTIPAGWLFLDEICVYGTTTETSDNNGNNVPQTGDNVTIIIYGIIALTAIWLTGAILKRRKINELK